LGVGEPDFSAPWAARSAAIDALERGKTSYTANRGRSDLRANISEHVKQYDLEYDPDEEILVTAGASEAVDLAMRALVDPGETVAVPKPSYISYAPSVTFAGGEVRLCQRVQRPILPSHMKISLLLMHQRRQHLFSVTQIILPERL